MTLFWPDGQLLIASRGTYFPNWPSLDSHHRFDSGDSPQQTAVIAFLSRALVFFCPEGPGRWMTDDHASWTQCSAKGSLSTSLCSSNWLPESGPCDPDTLYFPLPWGHHQLVLFFLNCWGQQQQPGLWLLTTVGRSMFKAHASCLLGWRRIRMCVSLSNSFTLNIVRVSCLAWNICTYIYLHIWVWVY